jgi:uncharacterized protein (AIM24 family)
MPLTSITGEETNLDEIQANGHMCTYEIHVDASAKVSVHRVVLAGDGSLINCGSFLAYIYYTSVAKVCSMLNCAVK